MKERSPNLGTNSTYNLDATLMAHDVLPNPQQLALFQTILAPDADLPARWNEWTAQLAHGLSLDSPTLLNLPLLHKRLKLSQAERSHCEALAPVIAACYRRTWVKNQVTFSSLKASLLTLHEAGVETLVLKGAALIGAYYEDMGARSMGDFDILVPEARFLPAADALTRAGWKPMFSARDFDARFDHALHFEDRRGNFLDLHVHVLHVTTQPDAEKLFWADSVPIMLAGVQTRTLSGADQILHLAEHGMYWVPDKPLRWIPDIAQVIARGNPDWERLPRMARHLHKSIAVVTALEYLNENQLASVPETVLDALRAIPVDPWQRVDFALNARDKLGSFKLAALAHWHRLNQERYVSPFYQRLRLLPEYITFCAKRSGHRSWLGYFFDGRIVIRHLTAKQAFGVKSSAALRARP